MDYAIANSVFEEARLRRNSRIVSVSQRRCNRATAGNGVANVARNDNVPAETSLTWPNKPERGEHPELFLARRAAARARFAARA